MTYGVRSHSNRTAAYSYSSPQTDPGVAEYFACNTKYLKHSESAENGCSAVVLPGVHSSEENHYSVAFYLVHIPTVLLGCSDQLVHYAFCQIVNGFMVKGT